MIYSYILFFHSTISIVSFKIIFTYIDVKTHNFDTLS
nr:MAG TPA: hypothetical protein [Caudoviricetes sp.]